MAKKILQKHLNYQLDAPTGIYVEDQGDVEIASYFNTNVARDLSFSNRQNIEQVSRKGDLMNFGLKVTCSGTAIRGPTGASNEDGPGGVTFFYPSVAGSTPGTEDESDHLGRGGLISVRFFAPHASWVLKNGVKKTHFAREEMFKKAMVEKSSRGAYSHSMRPALASGSETYTSLLKGTTPDPYTGGTWDITQLAWEPDTDGAFLCLTGAHADENSTTTFSNLSIPQMYLQSRSGKMETDTNVDDLTQAKFSVLNSILTPDTTDASDEVVDLAKSEHDNPPYDLLDSSNDCTQLVEVGRLNFNPSTGSIASTYIEVPGGIFKTQVYVGDILTDLDLNWSMDMQVDLVKWGTM